MTFTSISLAQISLNSRPKSRLYRHLSAPQYVKLSVCQTENFIFLHKLHSTLILSALRENSSYQTPVPQTRNLGLLQAPSNFWGLYLFNPSSVVNIHCYHLISFQLDYVNNLLPDAFALNYPCPISCPHCCQTIFLQAKSALATPLLKTQ